MISTCRRKDRCCDSSIFCSETMARNSLTKICLWGHHLMWVSSAAVHVCVHMIRIHPLFLSTSSIFLGELFLQLCGDPNQGTGEAEKKPSLSIAAVFSLMALPGQFTGWLCNWGDKWKQLGEKETNSWGLLNLAWIPFCPNGWGDEAPAFPSWFRILLICISKVKS